MQVFLHLLIYTFFCVYKFEGTQLIGNWRIEDKQTLIQDIKKVCGGRQTLMQMQLQ